MSLDLTAVRARFDAFQASHRHDNGFACCTAHATAEDVPALLAEIDRLRAHLATASRRVRHIAEHGDPYTANALNTIADELRAALDNAKEA